MEDGSNLCKRVLLLYTMDGNCMFWSICHKLNLVGEDNQYTAGELRQKLVDHIQNMSKIYIIWHS